MRLRTALVTASLLAVAQIALPLPESTQATAVPVSLINDITFGVFCAPEDLPFAIDLPRQACLGDTSGDYLLTGTTKPFSAADQPGDTDLVPLSLGYYRSGGSRPWAVWGSFYRRTVPATGLENTVEHGESIEKTVPGEAPETTQTTYRWSSDSERLVYRANESSRSLGSVAAALPGGPLRAGFVGAVWTESGMPESPEAYAAANTDRYVTTFVDAAAADSKPDVRVEDLVIASKRYHRYVSACSATLPFYLDTDSAVDHGLSLQGAFLATDELRTEEESFLPDHVLEPRSYTTTGSSAKSRLEDFRTTGTYQAVLPDPRGDWRVSCAGSFRYERNPVDREASTRQGYSFIPGDETGVTEPELVATHRDTVSRRTHREPGISWGAEVSFARSLYLETARTRFGMFPRLSASYESVAPGVPVPISETEILATDENGDADQSDSVDRITTTEKTYAVVTPAEDLRMGVALRLPAAFSIDVGSIIGGLNLPVRLLLGGSVTGGRREHHAQGWRAECTETTIRTTGAGDELGRESAPPYPVVSASPTIDESKYYLEYEYAIGLSLAPADAVRVDLSFSGDSLLELDSLAFETTIVLK